MRMHRAGLFIYNAIMDDYSRNRGVMSVISGIIIT